jgi:hypothetical protein
MFLQSLFVRVRIPIEVRSRIDLMRVIGQLACGQQLSIEHRDFGGTSLNKLYSLGVSLSCSAVQSLFRRGS